LFVEDYFLLTLPLTDSSVAVLEADDVVFAEIGAGLYLDQVQRGSCRGFSKAVRGARAGYRGRLVLGQQSISSSAAADARGALHDDPIARRGGVHLQRQLAARLDDDVLDLDPVAGMQASRS